jgi:hypothetical protein
MHFSSPIAISRRELRCLALVLPDGYEQLGKTLDHCISTLGCVLAQIKMVRLTRAQAETLFARESGTPGFAYATVNSALLSSHMRSFENTWLMPFCCCCDAFFSCRMFYFL